MDDFNFFLCFVVLRRNTTVRSVFLGGAQRRAAANFERRGHYYLGVRGARGAGDRLLTLWCATVPAPKTAKSSQLTPHLPKMERIVQKTAQTELHVVRKSLNLEREAAYTYKLVDFLME